MSDPIGAEFPLGGTRRTNDLTRAERHRWRPKAVHDARALADQIVARNLTGIRGVSGEIKVVVDAYRPSRSVKVRV
jgi:hypothetical protein